MAAVVENWQGLYSYAFGEFDVDTQAPTVTGIWPYGNTDNVTSIDASYIDPGNSSGINVSSANLILDNVLLTDCYRDQLGISCPSGMVSGGQHTVTVMVDDNLGHEAFTGGTFTVVCSGARPGLTLELSDAFWGSYADYVEGLLTVNYLVHNTGPDAYAVTMTSITGTNGVSYGTKRKGCLRQGIPPREALAHSPSSTRCHRV